MSDEITVRPATVADVPDLVRLRRVMFESMGCDDRAQLDGSDAANAAYFAGTIPAGSFHGWLAITPQGEAAGSGGVATPADAALMMQLGVDGVFVGSGVFKSGDPAKRAHAIVQAVTHYNDPAVLAEVSRSLGEPMVGINISEIPEVERLAVRGW